MLFQTTILAILASASLVVALPGDKSKTTETKTKTTETTCSAGKNHTTQTHGLDHSLTV